MHKFVENLTRMPVLGGSPKFSRDALRLLLDGKELEVKALVVRCAHIDTDADAVRIEFVFVDDKGDTVVNVGSHIMRAGDSLTLADITNALYFNVT